MSHTSLIKAFVIALALTLAVGVEAQNTKKHNKKKQPKAHVERPRRPVSADTTGYAEAYKWADDKMSHMSDEERVAQLMFVRVPLNMNTKQRKAFERNFTRYGVGGICFFKGTATKQLELTRRYQRLSDLPLMVTIDGEWGLGMRLTDCYSFPMQMLMGALSPANDSLITRMGEEIGIQCRNMGIHVNFAPVCDINNNPANPVIGYRSFGENKARVARKADLYARAMQRKSVIAVGKHFPGHGDTDVDSHLDLPVITHAKEYIDSVDLYPFRRLVRGGIRGMMVAHLQVNAIDDRPNMPSSLSEKIVNPLLREALHFDGLVFTDGIDMKAVSKHYKDGEGAIRAIRAGNDIILLPIDVEKTIAAVLREARRDPDFAEMVDDRCRRILREKYLSGLHTTNLDDLHVPTQADVRRCEDITRQMAQRALTLVKNDNYALPLDRKEKTVFVALGNGDTTLGTLSDALRSRIRQAGHVVISLYANMGPAKNYGVSDRSIALVKQIASIEGVSSTLVIYGSPYILASFPDTARVRPDAIVVAYQNIAATRSATRAALYGDEPFDGILPVSAGGYSEGTSLKAVRRVLPDYYADLRRVGMDVRCFKQIDTIVMNGIAQKAYPGCQLLVAKDGEVVYNRCYGNQTYMAGAPAVDSATVYDLASLTKVCATTLAVMKLVDAGKISLDDRLSKYLPYLKHTNKKHITVRQALSHFARLKAFDAYWKPATEDSSYYEGTMPPEGFTAIGDNAYIDPDYRKTFFEQIAESKLEAKNKYLYSDLGFILLADLVQHVSGQSIDVFMHKYFYEPLQMGSTCFQPLSHGISLGRIAPTEEDKTFRHQLLRGYVHDPNAAALGGVAGHAGLFSTATDLFRLYQMMLNGGTLDGRTYVSASTLATFNSRHFADKGNRRALGFDKPFINGGSTHIAPMASQSSFGHTGFTGTMVWVDPQYGLVYIFLSNRVHPSATPNKLASMNIRTDIQKLIYQSIGVR